jgi:hypothetical protein
MYGKLGENTNIIKQFLNIQGYIQHQRPDSQLHRDDPRFPPANRLDEYRINDG